ncbi:WD40 repeat-like protein [Auriculariales sp. MPI-PUGE-AT-0066]|nr:WD40 repeat-like protein [Auriculariales sp. MPI-PUGE-AT-0066]
MPKVSRKRQHPEPSISALGDLNLDDVREKDEEELALEAALFGASSAIARKSRRKPIDNHVAADEDDELMGDVRDSDLFFVDDGEAAVSAHSVAITSIAPRRKKAAWVDEDDDTLRVALKDQKRLRKLREDVDEDLVEGATYERRLRKQYEKLNPTPSWLSKARERTKTGSQDGDEITDLLAQSGGLLSHAKSKTLPSGVLDISRLRDANISAPATGTVHSVLFHPSPTVPVLLSTSGDKRIRLYTIDAHTNPHLQSVHVSDLAQPQAMFHPTGSVAYLTGMRPWFYTYDLQTGSMVKGHRLEVGSTNISSLSADGSTLAFSGGSGIVHLVDARARQPVGQLKANTALADITFTANSDELVGLGLDSEVYVFDVRARRCTGRWRDVDGFGGSRVQSHGGWLATGSSTGYVNLYNSTTADASASFAQKPRLTKALPHLTTGVSTIAFNADAQMLGLASAAKKDQLKVVHLPSGTVYSNWPTSGTPLGVVSALAWSPGGEYLAIGNGTGRITLWALGWYTKRD